jgi:hypothetical protein
MNDTTDNLLLTYKVSTNPDPLQVSPQSGDVSCDPPPGDASCATLTILVSNSSEDIINCQSIDFGFSVGKNASDFSEDLTGVAVTSPPGWNFTPDGNDFTATPKTATDGAIGKDGLTFTLSKMKVNKEPGTASLLITETASSPTADPPQPQDDRTTSLPLAKFPLEFKVSDLMFAPDPPLDFGGSVTLSWVGTEGATYELRYEGCSPDPITQTKDNPPQPLPFNGNYKIDDLEKDTTFYLHVKLVVPGQDNPPTLERFVTVAVVQPQPKITSFTASFTSTKLILNWATTNAVSCTMSGDPHPVNLNSTDDSYFILWAASLSDTYTLTATNSVGKDTETIQVNPQITSFTASFTPSKLILKWETTNADSCTMSCRNTWPPSTGDPHPVNLNSTDDSYFILWADSPSDTYTLTATNSVGTVPQTIRVKPVLFSGMKAKDKSDNDKIYLVIDGTLRLIPSDEAYNNLFVPTFIVEIPTVNAYSLGQPLTNGDGDAYLGGVVHSGIYLIVDHKERLIPGDAVWQIYDFNKKAVRPYVLGTEESGPEVPY